MRILVVDDERTARAGLVRLLAREPDVEATADAADTRQARSILEGQAIDLVFLDIGLPGESGLEWLASLEPARRPLVVFITAHDQHAIAAFELHALDYLVKPYREDRLADAMARARARLCDRQAGDFQRRVSSWLAGQSMTQASAPGFPSRIRLESDGRIRFVGADDVVWIEAQDYCVLVHLRSGQVLQRGTLKQSLRQFDPRRFMRVHRSAAVNLGEVRELTVRASGSVVAHMKNGAVVPVARSLRATLEARLLEVP